MMNKLVLFFLLVSFYSQNEFNQKGERGCMWIGYHENGSVKYSGQFFNGKEVGVFKYFDMMVTLAIKLNYFQVDSSEATLYYDNGSIKAIGQYVNKQKVVYGLITYIWYQKNQEEQYNQGVLDGDVSIFLKMVMIADSYNYEKWKKKKVI